jgi:hypothetical protein
VERPGDHAQLCHAGAQQALAGIVQGAVLKAQSVSNGFQVAQAETAFELFQSPASPF